MCGIGGILRIVRPGDADYPEGGAASVPGAARGGGRWFIPGSWLDRLDESIAWRGPDGAGRFRDRVVRPDGTIVEVGLVHRRLAIIDLEGGAQPMVRAACPGCGPGDAGGAAAVVFNGCVYNHRALRAGLESAGHVFRTDHSDTEVLLHLMPGQWRAGRPEAMAAVLWWDRAAGRIVAARDPFGEKPLYTARVSSPDVVFFCSSPAALAHLAAEAGAPARGAGRASPTPALDAGAIIDWVALGYGAGATPWAGVTEAPVGSAARGSAGDTGSEGADAEADGPGMIRSVDHLDSLVRSAVVSRLDADVPLGCFLSGGVDSSLVASYAAEALGSLRTICVRMPDERYDESRHAEAVAAAIGADHTTVDAERSAAEDLVHLIETLGLPFGDSSILPTYWVCRAARREVKVALSGDGGDELFYGYDRYRVAPLMERFGRLVGMVPLGLLRRDRPGGRAERLARLVTAARSDDWYRELLAIFQRPDLRALFGGAEGRLRGGARAAALGEPRARDLGLYLPCDLMRKVDTASMLCGLEVRCPMLDGALSSAAIGTPRRLLVRGGRKGMLRELARRRLPRGVVDRPKQGFAIPISDWWRSNFGGLRDLLLGSLGGERPFGAAHDALEISTAVVRRMIDEHWSAGGLAPLHTARPVRARDHGQRLFALVSLSVWGRWVERRSRGAPAARGVRGG